jgi:hypothetical protein
LQGAGVGADVGASVGASVGAGVENDSAHSRHPVLTLEPSGSHWILPLGTTPSGPTVPEYSLPFTMSLSYPASVLKLFTEIGAAVSAVMAIVHFSELP